MITLSFEIEMNLLIQRYLLEIRGIELTLDEIAQRPRWKRVWYWWLALEKYDGKQRPNMSLEECKKIYDD